MGYDNIRNLILKSCHETLRKSLSLFFQACLNKNTFLDTWKTCQLAPIFKEGNKADLSCFQPISLLCCFSKLLEKNIFDAIYNHTKDTQHKSHIGFGKQSSASVQRLLFLDQIYVHYDKLDTDQLAVLYLDFANAFDTVLHTYSFTKN